MPSDVKALYDEARVAAPVSARSACALLRVALETLTREHLGYRTLTLDQAIARLVSEGRIDPELQQAMDVLRLTGNGAVHPREIQLDDAQGTVHALFEMVNVVTDRLIGFPARVLKLYESLPPEKRAHIEQRDRGD
jgi:hypothetical protein